MRLVTYSATDRGPRAGVLVEDLIVVDTQACAEAASLDGGIRWTSTQAIVARATPDDLRALDRASRELVASVGRVREEVTLHPPIPNPQKILCIGVNYRGHLEEAQREDPELGTQRDPVVFSKLNTTLVGDGGAIVLPNAAPTMIDWEGELAVVVGRACSGVSAAQALDYVAGYTVFNDVSARDVQLANAQWLVSKSFDTAGPCGPALVTADEVPDPQQLDLTTTVNGEVMQQSNTSMMITPVARLIEYISSFITLIPGDIIATGTPAGVGFARDPKVFLKPGDYVTVTVAGVGVLTNPVRAARD